MDPQQLRAIAGAIRIDRIMERINLLAEMARDDTGGVSRLAFSPQEAAAMKQVAEWMEAAGLTVLYDGIGNMFGAMDGNASCVESVMAGSHLDTVPNGGAFDGVLGVVGAIEVVEAMQSAEFKPKYPLEVVVWRCEEAAQFGQGRLGSLYFIGELSLESIWGRVVNGVPVASYLDNAASLPQRKNNRLVKGYLELHIEQGKRLEAAGMTVGSVTAIPGAIRWRISITGRADHSGATPMGMRHDALSATAELILAVERAGMDERSYETVATATAVRAFPGAWNVVPGSAELLTDVRGIEEGSITRVLDRIREIAHKVSLERGVEISIEEVTCGRPVKLDESMVTKVEQAASQLGYKVVRMPSGAGHDAQTVAPYIPTGMIFVPSLGGISHAPEEKSRPEDILAGIQVLAGGLLALVS